MTAPIPVRSISYSRVGRAIPRRRPPAASSVESMLVSAYQPLRSGSQPSCEGSIVRDLAPTKNAGTDLDSESRSRYRALRRAVGRLVSSNYDISSLCNLKCEGCLFFSGDDYLRYPDDKPPSAWDVFFEEEAQRGVNFAYIAGAEPSLFPDRIRAAHRYIPAAVIYTNSTRRIPEDIRYRIHVSVWGDDAQSTRYRGASLNARALRNYSGDDRALFVFTINALNVAEISSVAAKCSDHGVPLTFSYFSPTETYLSRLAAGSTNDDAFFRISSREADLRMDAGAFARARHAIEAAMRANPGTVIYSLAFDDWVTRTEGLYRLDDRGTATDCGNRLSRHHRHFNVDLTQNAGKCCSPNISCRECRAYAMAYSTVLTRHREFSQSTRSFRDWLEIWSAWSRMFLLPERFAEAVRD